jgi:hypothetical protein
VQPPHDEDDEDMDEESVPLTPTAAIKRKSWTIRQTHCHCCGERLTPVEQREATDAERKFEWNNLHISFAGEKNLTSSTKKYILFL